MEMENELITIESANDYLAAFAEQVTEELGNSKLKYVSTKSGRFKIDDNPVPGNKIICAVLAFAKVNVLYTTNYDEDNPVLPACFALSHKIKELVPHESVTRKKCDTCDKCAYNQMGSASLLPHRVRKEGKACQNRARLALLPVGYVNKDNNDIILDGTHILTEELIFMSLPVTSVSRYINYAKKIKDVQKLPPFGVVTAIGTEPDEDTVFKLTFEQVTRAKNTEGKLFPVNLTKSDFMPKIIARHEEARNLVLTPYPTEPLEEQAKPANPVKEEVEDTDDF